MSGSAPNSQGAAVAPKSPELPRPASSARALSPRAALNPLLIFTVIVLLIGLITNRQDYLLQGATALCYAIAATGLGLALGLSGEFLLGQLALFAIGAYFTASLTAIHSWSFWTAGLVGVGATTLVGLAMSLIGLRISRFYFAMVGFFLVSLIPNIVEIFHNDSGGTSGLVVPDYPNFFGTQLGNRGMYLLAGVALALALLLSRNVRVSPLGIQMRRMRESPAAVATSGVSPWRIRVATYVLSSVLAGVGGAIYSHLSGEIQPTQFDLTYTILLFAAVLVGGSTSLLGPCLGVILLYVIPQVVINVQGYSDLIYGGIVLISVILFRGGVEQAVVDLWRLISPSLPWARARPVEEGVDAQMAASSAAGEELIDELWALRDAGTPPQSVSVRGPRIRYGGVRALDMEDEDGITVKPGEVHLLLGPNGSGKTTLLNTLSGLARLDSGAVLIGDDDVTRCRPAEVARRGVSRSYQTPRLPDEVTPVELLTGMLGQMRKVSYVHWLLSDPIAWRARRQSRATADRVCELAALGAGRHRECSGLTSGQRRILDVLVALCSRAKIVLLDEPAAGLSETERKQLGSIVRALASRGMAFLVVEHDLELAMSMADRVTVLADGKLLAHGSPSDITAHQRVREVLIGAQA